MYIYNYTYVCVCTLWQSNITLQKKNKNIVCRGISQPAVVGVGLKNGLPWGTNVPTEPHKK